MTTSKILLIILIVFVCIFVITLIILKKNIFFKKMVKEKDYNKKNFWIKLDDINGAISVWSFAFIIATLITLLIHIIWGC